MKRGSLIALSRLLREPGLIPLGLALALPWTGAWRVGDVAAATAVTETPRLVFTTGALVALGLWIAAGDLVPSPDPPLGLFVAYMAVRALLAPQQARPFETAIVIALGAVLLVSVRGLSAAWHPPVRDLLIWGGVAMTLYTVRQWGGVDPLFPGGPHLGQRTPGPLGNSNWLGSALAITGALGPWWALPAPLVGLTLAQHRLGMIALVLGVLARPMRWRTRVLIAMACAGPAALVLGPRTWESAPQRLAIWEFGLRIWWANDPCLGLCGIGPGTWAWVIPEAQRQVLGVEHGWFLQAHHELLQLLFEGGAIAVGLVGWWLWRHRATLARAPARGAVVALAVTTVGMFPFHVPAVAALAVVVLGLATAEGGGGEG